MDVFGLKYPESFFFLALKKYFSKKNEKKFICFFFAIFLSQSNFSKMDIFFSKVDEPDILGEFKFSDELTKKIVKDRKKDTLGSSK